MRTIKFKLLTQQQLETIKVTVTTFGELKTEILKSEMAEKINFDGVKFIERNSKAEYGSIDEAILPIGDLLFFVTPTKTDSGCGDTQSPLKPISEIEDMSYNEIRTYISLLNKAETSAIDLTGTRNDIIARYIEWFNTIEILADDEIEDGSIQDLLYQSITLIEKAIILYSKLPENKQFAIEGITVEQLQEEAELLKAKLNK